MNRRGLIQKMLALGIIAPFAPAALKAAKLREYDNYGTPVACGSSTSEPPADLRTPEQVVEDSFNEHVESTIRDLQGEWTKYRKFCYRVEPDIFDAVWERCQERKLGATFSVIAGLETIALNGNVIRMNAGRVYINKGIQQTS